MIISYTIFKAYIHSMFRTSQLWRNNCANAPSIRKYGCYITVAVIFLWNDDATTTRTRHTVLRRYDYCLLHKYEYEIIFLFNDILRLTHQGRESTVVGCCSDILYEDATTKSDASTTVVRGQLVTPVWEIYPILS